MGTALKDFGMLDDAVLAYKKPCYLNPIMLRLTTILVFVYKQGKLDESVANL